jgi:multicomponent Na+:H+ antiporter subunit A
MFLAVGSGFAAAVFAPWIYRISRGAAGWLLAVLPFGLWIYFAGFVAAIATGEYSFSPTTGRPV